MHEYMIHNFKLFFWWNDLIYYDSTFSEYSLIIVDFPIFRFWAYSLLKYIYKVLDSRDSKVSNTSSCDKYKGLLEGLIKIIWSILLLNNAYTKLS